MRSAPVGVLFSCVFALVITAPAFAFGRKGHETTGAIAAKLISGTRAEKEVALITERTNRGYSVSVDKVNYELQKGGNEMLRIKKIF